MLRQHLSLCLGLCLVAISATASAQPNRQQRIERARTLFQDGLAAYESGDLNTALEKMKGAQRMVRRPAFAYNIARVLERMGEAGHSISWFRIYLRNGRPTPEERADVQERITGLEALQQRQLGQLREAPPSNDERMQESRTFFERGVSMYRRGEYQAAMQAFEYAQQFARFPELFYNIALTAEHMQRWREAAGAYREYLRERENAPDETAIRARMATLRERARQARSQGN